jgi:hypothetical protein
LEESQNLFAFQSHYSQSPFIRGRLYDSRLWMAPMSGAILIYLSAVVADYMIILSKF